MEILTGNAGFNGRLGWAKPEDGSAAIF